MGDEAKISYLKTKLREDRLAIDLQLSLLSSALSSYRHDTVLKPFPPMFNRENSDTKDFTRLEKTMEKCPPLDKLQKYFIYCEQNNTKPDIDSTLLDLLTWCITAKNFHIKSCEKDKYDVITSFTGQVVSVPSPTHIFEVVYTEQSEERFRERQSDKPIVFAYHGSRVDNFHSILHHGLQGHMSKNALFGEGTYLSSELSVSMPYAPTGKGWDKSILGDKLSCFAVCEVIDDEQFVKSGETDLPSGASNGESRASLPRTSSRSRIPGAEGGDVPEKYYVVRNNDLLRVKYLLVYAEKTPVKVGRTWGDFVKEHKFMLMLVMYALILLAVGLYNSPTFNYYLKRYFKRR